MHQLLTRALLTRALATRALLAIVIVGCSSAPSYAIINCYDYAYYRISNRDFSPVGGRRTDGMTAAQLTARLLELGYRIAVAGPTDSQLRDGDVLILADHHAGFVNTVGGIDNWVQPDPDTFVVARPLSGVAYRADALPAGAAKGVKKGGLFPNDNLYQFVIRSFSPNSDRSLVKVWRHPQGGIGKNDLWIGTWVPKNPRQAKGKPPMPSLRIFKKDGAFHVQLNEQADLEMSITNHEPTRMTTRLKTQAGSYTFGLGLSREGPETISGSWIHVHEGSIKTFQLELVLKEWRQQ